MDYLMLIDSINAVPTDHCPKLRLVGGIFLEETTAERCEQMLADAAEQGVPIKLLSGYRDSEYQQRLWNKDIARYLSDGMSFAEAQSLTARYLAKPGHSEHQTGLAADFCTPDWDDTQDDFSRTEQGRWLCGNAHRYGFILRYPRMKEHLTGIAYEPWHYRYVGLPHAEIIRSRGLTLEEYLYYYLFDGGQIVTEM